MSSALIHFSTSSSWRLRGIGFVQPRAACMARMMFSRIVSSSTSPSVLRFSGQNASPAAIATRGFLTGAVGHHAALVGVIGAEEQAGELGATGAQQAGQAHHLALVDGEIERGDRALAPRLLGACHRGRRSRRSASAGAPRAPPASPASWPSIFDTSSPWESSAVAHSPTRLPLRSTVMRSDDRVDLVEEVADEDDRHPLLLELAHDREQLLDLALIERGGRLVEDQHARVDVDGAGDRDHLLDRERVRRRAARRRRGRG